MTTHPDSNAQTDPATEPLASASSTEPLTTAALRPSLRATLLGAAAADGELGPIEQLLSQPVLPLGTWPTPLEEHLIGGSRVLVKRDDESGWSRGGSKTRKIEHLLGWMLARGHTTLVTVAGNITNLGFDLVPAAALAGVDLQLGIVDDPPLAAADRCRLFDGIASEIELLGPSRVAAARWLVARHQRIRRAGGRPLIVVPGASHPAAVAGNAVGLLELAAQLIDQGRPPPDDLVVATATGNTIAGLLSGASALAAAGIPVPAIHGIQVYGGPIDLAGRALYRWTGHHVGLRRRHRLPWARLTTSELRGGFGHFDDDLTRSCLELAEATGVTIDPIFGGKAWQQVAPLLAASKERTVLYWHCGYTPEWAEIGAALTRNGDD